MHCHAQKEGTAYLENIVEYLADRVPLSVAGQQRSWVLQRAVMVVGTAAMCSMPGNTRLSHTPHSFQQKARFYTQT